MQVCQNQFAFSSLLNASSPTTNHKLIELQTTNSLNKELQTKNLSNEFVVRKDTLGGWLG